MILFLLAMAAIYFFGMWMIELTHRRAMDRFYRTAMDGWQDSIGICHEALDLNTRAIARNEELTRLNDALIAEAKAVQS